MKLLGALFIAAIFLTAFVSSVNRPPSQQTTSPPTTSASFAPKAGNPISLDFIPLQTPPNLSPIISSCTATGPQNQLSWNDTGASPYTIFKNQAQLGTSASTSFTDSSITAGQSVCYFVQGTQGSNSIGQTVSNNQCLITKSCSTLANGGGGGTNPTSTPNPTQNATIIPSASTPTPTPKPTASPAPLPAYCQTNTFTSSGRPVISVASLGGDIQKALDCFKDNKTQGGAVYVPAGNYTVLSKIRVYSNVTLFGDGIDQTILQLDSSLLTDPGGILANDTNYGHNNISVREMTLRGLFKESGILNCCPGIILRQLEGAFLDRIKVEGFSWHGIWLAYKKQTSGSVDTVKNIRISNCQIVNNKGAGVELDSPTSYVIVDHCSLSGNNHGTQDTHKNGAAINMFMDEDGLVTKNKVLFNTVSNNSYRGISSVARNNITAIKTTKIFNNSVCNNTVENNADAGITDGNSEENFYIANRIINNNDNRDGKVQTGSIRYWDLSTLEYFNTPANSSLNMQENEAPGATSPDCAIPDNLATIPPLPPKPGSVQGTSTSIFDILNQLKQLLNLKF